VTLCVAAVREIAGPSGSRLNARDGLWTIGVSTGGGRVVDGGGGRGRGAEKSIVAEVQLSHVTSIHFNRTSEYYGRRHPKFMKIFI
jgi:hypothetical protein